MPVPLYSCRVTVHFVSELRRWEAFYAICDIGHCDIGLSPIAPTARSHQPLLTQDDCTLKIKPAEHFKKKHSMQNLCFGLLEKGHSFCIKKGSFEKANCAYGRRAVMQNM